MEGCGTSTDPWIVVNTNPHRERLVLENLQRQPLNAYFVMHRGIKIRLNGEMVMPAYGT
jgi:hypothetical protein